MAQNDHRQLAGKVYHISLHAEMNALIRSIKATDKTATFLNINKKNRRSKEVMYVARLTDIEKTKGNITFGNSMPCDHCQTWMHKHKIKVIKYTDFIDGKNVICTLKIN